MSPKDFRNDPHARVVYTPVVPRAKSGKDEGSSAASSLQASPLKADPFARAENEDDDGYDPYSDRPAPADPLFERDPWS